MTDMPFTEQITEMVEGWLADGEYKLRAGFTLESAVAELALQVKQDRDDYLADAAEQAAERYQSQWPEVKEYGLEIRKVAYEGEYATEAEADAADEEWRTNHAAMMAKEKAAIAAAKLAILAAMTPGHEYGISDPLFELTVPITSHRSQALKAMERDGRIIRIPRTTPKSERSDAKLVRSWSME